MPTVANNRDNIDSPRFGEPLAGLSRVATATFLALFLMNLLDYVDRWALSGVLTKLQPELGIDDEQAGALNGYFLISYSLFCPVMGWAGDRYRRTRLLTLGIAVWSLATIGTGLARNYTDLRIARSILGIGEATYGVLAPTLLMDLFPRGRRSRVLATFYLAMPLGYALGVFLGGWITDLTGSWRPAFFVVGAPGFVAALAAWFLPEPLRGISEGVDPERLREHEKAGASWADYRDLLVNSSYTYTVFGLAAYTFAFGGLAFWLPSFLERVKEVPRVNAGLYVGLTGLCAAITGMSGGGWLADRLARRRPTALFLVSGVSMFLAVPCIVLGLLANSVPAILTWMFLAQVFLFANTGPSNAIIANVVQPNLRATAYAISTFAIHFLGDVWSPRLMGRVSEFCGKPSTMATGLGSFLSWLGFVPTPDGKNLGGRHAGRRPGSRARRDRPARRHAPPPPRDGPDARPPPRRSPEARNRPAVRRTAAGGQGGSAERK